MQDFKFYVKFIEDALIKELSRDVITHNTEDCESRVLMIERSQK
jgi:protein required for attachment to host cells